MMMRDLVARAAGTALILVLAHGALADDPAPDGGDLTRQQLGRVLAVLRLQPAAAGGSCLDSLRDMHKTEDQVKALQIRAKDPDKALAQDVLESDYENSKEICGADAARLCGAPGTASGVPAACDAMRRGGRSQ
nr:hypothetical protein [uncultured Lichenicoccus sp.]